MSAAGKTQKIIIGLAALLLAKSLAWAVEDGFSSAGKIESKHFSVFYSPKLEISSLTRTLDVGAVDTLLISKPAEVVRNPGIGLDEMLDTLFTRVCDILDMQLYSFKGTLKICPDNRCLKEVYYNLFNRELKSSSFYVYNLNTIYISEESFTREILGHEIAHAIISHYFVVQPSVKIQEVLAGYVEYQLRKLE